MHILVTGSAGRIGRAAVETLLARGHDVRGFDRLSANCESAGFSEIIGDICDAELARSAAAGVDTILHLGAFMSWMPEDEAAMFRTNVDGTRNLLQAAQIAKVERFVFASSGEVYPENSPDFLPICEGHPLRPSSPYGLTKLMGEELVGFYQRTGRIETVILRFSHTQAASELFDEDSFFSGPRFFLRSRIRQQEALGNSEMADLLQRHDPGQPAHILARSETGRAYKMHITDVRDMVNGLVLAAEKPEATGEIFNLGFTDPVDFEPLIVSMSEVTDYPIVTIDLPGPGVYYHTSNNRIRDLLGFEPEWTIERMLKDGAMARQAQLAGQT